MTIHFRITSNLLGSIHNDLSRPHSHAAERVGFISCRVGGLSDSGLTILADKYHPVKDSHYVENKLYGAMIGTDAIRDAMQFSYQHSVSMFHVHRHEHKGLPHFSSIDLRESNKLIPDFWNVQPNLPHGIIVLSHNSINGICWNPKTGKPERINTFSIIPQTTSTARWIA